MNDRYKKVLEKGKPTHTINDDFYIKHPPMDLTRRAKIFSPFDALKGYDEELVKTELDFEANNSDIERIPAEEYP